MDILECEKNTCKFNQRFKEIKKKLFWRNFASSFKKFAFINKLTKRVLYERRD